MDTFCVRWLVAVLRFYFAPQNASENMLILLEKYWFCALATTTRWWSRRNSQRQALSLLRDITILCCCLRFKQIRDFKVISVESMALPVPVFCSRYCDITENNGWKKCHSSQWFNLTLFAFNLSVFANHFLLSFSFTSISTNFQSANVKTMCFG